MNRRILICICAALIDQSMAVEPAKPSSIYDLTLKELMEISVITSASGFEQSLDQVFSANTVVSKEEWEAFGATTLSDVLKTVVGMHVGKATIPPNHQHYMIRGLAGDFGEQVKLMIDGRPIKRGFDAGRLFGFNLPLGGFKRIEVVRGPGSAVYGADAYGGVINLVSNEVEDDIPALTVGVGDFGSRRLSLQQSFGQEQTHLSVSLDYMNYDDDPGRIVSSDQQTLFDELFGTQASNAPGAIDEHFEVMTLNVRTRWHDWSLDYFGWRNFDGGLAGGIAKALDDKGGFSAIVDIWTLDWALGERFDIGSLNFTVNYHENVTKPEFYLFPAGSLLPVGNDGNLDFASPVGMSLFTDGVIGAPFSFGHYLNLKLTQIIDYKTHKIRWQVGYQQDSLRTREAKNFGPGVLDGSQAVVDGQLTDVTGTDHIYLTDVGSRFYFLSIMDQWEVNERWLLNIGARYDHYSNFGSTTNPRLGLIYRFTPQLKAKLFAGSAFRAPSFNELYIRNNPVTRGNPELEPETVDTLETGLGFEYTVGDNLFIAADVFRYHAKDLIAFEFNPQLQFNQAANTGELTGHGLEFNIRYKPISDITLTINGSLLEAKDEDEVPLVGYPGKMLYGGIAWRLNESVSWSIESRWVGDRAREADDLRPEIDGYIWFNSSLTIQDLLPQLAATFSVKNLFDADASEPATAAIADDFPLHGRFWQLQLRYHF